VKSAEEYPVPELFDRSSYRALVEEIQFLAHQYYVLDSPLVDDAFYDDLFRLLQRVESLHTDLRDQDSPLKKIGGEISKDFSPVPHDPPMLSLDNALSLEEFLVFDERIRRETGQSHPEYHAEPKYDGLAAEILYLEGILRKASTRGDGFTGEDITHTMRTVANVPLSLRKKPGRLLIRGEVVMKKQDFLDLNAELTEKGKKNFANPRNAAAGSLRLQDSSVTRSRRLTFFPYSVTSIEGFTLPELQSDIWNTLFPELGFRPGELSFRGGREEVLKHYEAVESSRSELPFDIDGIVIKMNSLKTQQELGTTTRSPKFAIAWKFAARAGYTRINSIVYQTGRTGVITPVANLEPVTIGGVVVSRATLHNQSQMEKLDIRQGDTVEVIRSGDVIPRVVRVVPDEKHASREAPVFPTHCPSCGGPLVKEDIFVRCPNPDCSGRVVAQIQYFVSRDGIDVETLGEEWVQKFYSAGIISDAADIFALTKEQILPFEKMGEKLAAKIIASIHSRRSIPFAVFLRSLGIPGVGSHIAQILSENSGNLETLLAMDEKELTAIHEVGPATAKAIAEFRDNPRNRNLLEKFRKYGVELISPAPKKDSSFSGKTFVFTGTLKKLSRTEAAELVKERSGRVSGSVSAKTDYVVAGEAAGSKLEKAEQLQLTILTEEEFLSML